MAVIGIDLGTTYSCVGHFKKNKVNIIENDHGNRITASFVAFTDNSELVGDSAQQQSAMNPKNTVFNAKRLIGRRYIDPEVQQDCKNYSFKVAEKDGNPIIEVESRGAIKQFTPEKISSMVLSKMKEIAERSLGGSITGAVITVPAYFNNSQRESTKRAGAMAGLNVLQVLNEPTAAALAYSLDIQGDNQNFLVFDLGGGTFDVSLLNHNGQNLKVLATGGDTHLGGEDFDNRLVDYFVEDFKKKNGKDISQNYRALRRLRSAVERTKRKLSFTDDAFIEIDCLFEGIDLYTSFTRDKFESLCDDLFKSTLEPVVQVLKDANLSKSDISQVVLVGGSTRIPKVKELLSEFFGGKSLNYSVNPDEAVAYGAAIRAASLNGDLSDSLRELTLQDICPFSLGIETDGGIMNVIIPRNTPIPTTAMTRGFQTSVNYQQAISVKAFEGERLLTQKNKQLGNFRISGLPSLPRGQAGVTIALQLDTNGILTITAVDQSDPNNTSKLVIKNIETSPPKTSVENLLRDALKYKDEDMKEVNRVRARIDMTSVTEFLSYKLPLVKDHVAPIRYDAIRKLLDSEKTWLCSNQDALLEDYVKRGEALTNMAIEKLGFYHTSPAPLAG